MPPKRTEKHDGISQSERKDRSQDEKTNAGGSSVEHKSEEEVVKEVNAFSAGYGVPVTVMMSMEQNIRGDIQEATSTLTTIMMDFIAEMRELKRSSKEWDKISVDDKLKNSGTKQFVDQGQGSRSSQAGVCRLEESSTLVSLGEDKYILPHKTEDESWTKGRSRNDDKYMASQVFVMNSPNMPTRMYEVGEVRGISVPNSRINARGAEYPPHMSKKNPTLVTGVCEAFKNVLQEKINKGVLKFPEKNKTMTVDEDNFPLVANVNVNNTDLRSLINEKRGNVVENRFVRPKNAIQKYWVPRGMMFEINDRRTKNFHGRNAHYSGRNALDSRRNLRYSGGSMAARPVNQCLKNNPFAEPVKDERKVHQYAKGKMSWRTTSQVNHQKMERKPRFIVPPITPVDGKWRRLEHPKSPRPLSRTQKRRLLRERAAERMMKIEESSKEKKKFDRKATEDFDEENDDLLSEDENNDVVKRASFKVGQILVSFECTTGSLVLPDEFTCKKTVESDIIRDEVVTGSVQDGILKEDVEFLVDEGKRVIMNKPSIEMTKHIKLLYITAHVNGNSVSRVLIDNGSAVNSIPHRMLQKLRKNVEDLIPTEVLVAAFTGESTKTLRVLPSNVIVGSQSPLSAYFVVNTSASFHALLGRDWIHANHCVPSSMHQLLLMWNEDDVKVVQADSQPYQHNSNAVEARYYDEAFVLIKFCNFKVNGQSKIMYMDTKKIKEAVEKFFKLTATVSSRPMVRPIIEEVDD